MRKIEGGRLKEAEIESKKSERSNETVIGGGSKEREKEIEKER